MPLISSQLRAPINTSVWQAIKLQVGNTDDQEELQVCSWENFVLYYDKIKISAACLALK